MAALDEDAWLVLHEIRLRGVLDPASLTGRGEGADIVVTAERLVALGYVAVAARGWYEPALAAALARADAGDEAWVASPRCDSYHTVWMRLHEDLLLALGRERSA